MLIDFGRVKGEEDCYRGSSASAPLAQITRTGSMPRAVLIAGMSEFRQLWPALRNTRLRPAIYK